MSNKYGSIGFLGSDWSSYRLAFRTILVGFICLLAVAQAEAEVEGSAELTPELEQDIRVLMELAGVSELGAQMGAVVSRSMLESFWKTGDAPSEGYREIVLEETDRWIADVVELFSDAAIPLYANYFSHEEILALIEFYDSPIGRKSIRVMPSLMQDSAVLGQELGMREANKLSAAIEKRLREAGYID